MSDARIDKLEPAGKPDGADAVFAELSRDKASAARMALGYLKADGQAGKKLRPLVEEIHGHEARLKDLPDPEIQGQTARLRERIAERVGAVKAEVERLLGPESP